MDEQDTVFSTHVGPEGIPAVGMRMAITEGRSDDGRPRATDAAADPGGAWVVTYVSPPDPDMAIDIYLTCVTGSDAERL